MRKIKLMMFDEGTDGSIRCSFISKGFKRISFVSSKDGIEREIKKLNPDAVVLNMDLYNRVDGIETAKQISDRFNIPVWYE